MSKDAGNVCKQTQQRKIDLINVFSMRHRNDYVRGNHFCKVIHDDSCENFLNDELSLFCMEMNKPDSVFQISERCFDTPAHGI
jgi:hypothetical protein